MRAAIARLIFVVPFSSTVAVLIFLRAKEMDRMIDKVNVRLLVSRTVARLVVEFAINSVKSCPQLHIGQSPLHLLQLRFFLVLFVILMLALPLLLFPLLGSREVANGWSMFINLRYRGQRNIKNNCSIPYLFLSFAL